MTMLMMHVGHVRVGVHNLIMLMPMGVRFARWIVWRVRMLMMFVMTVRVGMSHWLMDVLVPVVLCEVKPHAGCHERARGNKLKRDRLAEREECAERPEEGGGGKIRSGSCRSQMA